MEKDAVSSAELEDILRSDIQGFYKSDEVIFNNVYYVDIPVKDDVVEVQFCDDFGKLLDKVIAYVNPDISFTITRNFRLLKENCRIKGIRLSVCKLIACAEVK